MITANEYLKIIVQKKKLKQAEILRKMNGLGMGKDGVPINKQHISNILNGIRPLSPYMARKFEIVLGLEKYSVVKMVGFPNGEKSMQTLKDIDKFEEILKGKNEKKP